jgi:glycosyltransferase involved in cell wall biosynthesis
MIIRPHSMPHVVHVSFFNDPAQRLPEQLLAAWPTLVDVAEAASQSRLQVSVVQASAHTDHFERNRVRYFFLPLGLPGRPAPGFADLIRRLAADLYHIHGLGFPRQVLSLAALAPGVPMVLQDHASRPPRLWHRALWRRAMNAAAGISFCALAQAEPFATAGMLHPAAHLYEIPEATSRFTPGDREQARRSTGAAGEPLVLWVGHLNENKDPLTALRGISEAARALPGLQLWCCFGTAPLLPEVQRRVAKDPFLSGRVHLLGPVPHAQIEQLMRAADIFVQASHRESTGFALIEAIACGLPPVVTDIPSFRAITGAGAIGQLWPRGDFQSLCEGLRAVSARPYTATRNAVRLHFERELSFAALGAKLAALYHDVLARERALCRQAEATRA